ncbi:ABC transporter substrate-binding protein [Pseudonocardia sp. CA-142604]|uniref:ABC transporter substrate-binding protein n=1 Tax=Pseudonocardia sp. CA-142604 TaxID=3240024 RepID=UPI003D8D0C1C
MAVAVAMVAALLAACGAVGVNQGGGADGRSPLVPVRPWGGDPATEGEPRTGGTLIIGNDREVASFDPTVQNGNLIAPAVYDSLLRLSPGGEVVPYLAESMETPDDARTWVMRLRDGVLFSDGTPLDAEAVVINTQRHIDAPASPAAAYARQITAMRAIDPLTVEFSLAVPLGNFPAVFTQGIFAGTLGMIISPAAIAQYGDEVGAHPVGAGPFRLTSWQRDSRMLLQRNEHYWQPGLPRLDGLEVRPLSDTETRFASIINGDVDLINGGYPTELLRAYDDPRFTVYYGPSNGGFFFTYNFSRPPFDDRRMREAVAHAIDVRALAASLYSNQLISSDSLFATGSPFDNPTAGQGYPEFDLERARQLVADYVADGGSAAFSFKASRTDVTLGEFVQAQLAAAGMQVEVELYDLAEFTGSILQSGDFELVPNGTSFDYPYPAASRLLHTDGSINFGSYSNPEVDRLLDQAASSTDETERTTLYGEVERLVNQDLALLFLNRSYMSTITLPDVRGVQRYITRDLFYANLWLDRSGS